MFRLRQDVREVQTRRAILTASLTYKVGDVVRPSDGDNSITNASVDGDLYPIGVLVGFSKDNGQVIGSGTDPLNTPASLTTISTNLTVDKYYGVYIPITGDMEWSATLDAVAGTTTYSDKKFVWFNLQDCRLVDESDAVVYSTGAATPLQILSLGLDPEDTTNFTIICRFAKAGLIRS